MSNDSRPQQPKESDSVAVKRATTSFYERFLENPRVRRVLQRLADTERQKPK